MCWLFCIILAIVENSGGFSVRQGKRLPRALILGAPLLDSKGFPFHTYSVSYVSSLK